MGSNFEEFVYHFEDDMLSTDIPFYFPTVLMIGDSGSGKSLLCNRIKAAKISAALGVNIKTNYDIKKTFVASTRDALYKLRNLRDSLLFIDRFDMIVDEDNYDLAMKLINDQGNLLVIMHCGKIKGIKAVINSYVYCDKKQRNGKMYLECSI